MVVKLIKKSVELLYLIELLEMIVCLMFDILFLVFIVVVLSIYKRGVRSNYKKMKGRN